MSRVFNAVLAIYECISRPFNDVWGEFVQRIMNYGSSVWIKDDCRQPSIVLMLLRFPQWFQFNRWSMRQSMPRTITPHNGGLRHNLHDSAYSLRPDAFFKIIFFELNKLYSLELLILWEIRVLGSMQHWAWRMIILIIIKSKTMKQRLALYNIT